MANTTTDKLEYLQGTKNVLKTQLTAKGVAVPSNTTFRQMANLVGTISNDYAEITLSVPHGAVLSASAFNGTQQSYSPTSSFTDVTTTSRTITATVVGDGTFEFMV